MAKCTECGKNAGLMMSLCDDCIRKQNDAARTRPVGPTAPPMLSESSITTAFELPGQTIVRSVGVVRGLSVRSRSILGNAIAGVEATFGGPITTFERLCDDTRKVAFDRLRANAVAVGANAVVALRFDANEVADGITEVLCYGTGVVAEPTMGTPTA